MEQRIIIHTDGACSGNPGKGGFGVVMQLENSNYYKEISQGFLLTTNNRMELLAVIVALETIKIPKSKVVVISDSKYVVDAVNQNWIIGWRKKNYKDVKNPDLWKRFSLIFLQHQVTMQWIKGHNNHPLNERCDFLAVEAIKKEPLLIDEGYQAVLKKNKEKLL
jgi:ribonuclease HI